MLKDVHDMIHHFRDHWSLTGCCSMICCTTIIANTEGNSCTNWLHTLCYFCTVCIIHVGFTYSNALTNVPERVHKLFTVRISSKVISETPYNAIHNCVLALCVPECVF
jgi:hypothetical protein